ncbi:hypothetical protein CPB86DRAFT_819443 [Serendipita vermifera]|nr:hypothetical protein CPB86DRAFT_819443 [Serendipita vermifera]
MLSADQIASFIYSTASTYWYLGRILWYRPKGLDIIEDYSVQAASSVCNVSLLLYSLVFIFSIERRQAIWGLFLIWNVRQQSLSPISFVNRSSLGTNLVNMLILLLFLLFILIGRPTTPRWKLAPCLIVPFILLEAVRSQFFTQQWSILPRSAAKLTDLDQIVSLSTAAVVVVYQWELWNLPRIARQLRMKFRRSLTRRNSIQLEENIPEPRTSLSNPELTEVN